MKKLLALALFAFCFSMTTSAQDKGKVEFGINIGYNGSTISNSKNSAARGSGINLGFAADYYFSKRWSIKGKLIYDQKGWNDGYITFFNEFDPSIPGNIYTTDFNLNYLTIPVMANWHFGRTKNWYLNFGPYVGFLMNAKETKFGTDLKDGFNTTDFGLSVGIGVKIPVSDKLKISLEYDGQDGFTQVFKQSDGTITNSRFSLNVGVNFLLK
ncbi:porin family protein [Flavobacterium sp.]|uniref:porin family protein n=1 Tax=Flavobacterium sp. TaxID=239 RepID=UPI002615C5A1|nr:porin family protein [Flavobacterium sp.]